MKSTLKKQKNAKAILTVEVEPALVESRFKEVFQQIQRKAALPGFREGKAPLEMIEKRFMEDAHEEVIKSLVPEAYHHSLTQHDVEPVSLPKVSDVKMTRGGKLTFNAEFERVPDFNVKNYKGLKIKKEAIDVKDDDVEKGILSLQESRSELSPLLEARAVKHGDFVISDLEVWQGGQYAAGRKGVPLLVEPNEGDDFFTQIVGANVSDVREVTAEYNAEEKKQGLVGRKPMFKVTVREIREKKLPELNEEFAKIYGKNSVDELKAAVRKDLASLKQNNSYENMKHELYQKLLSLASFELPEGLVERQTERLIEQTKRHYAGRGVTAEQFAKEKDALRPEAEKKAKEQVQLYFILRHIADQEKIEVGEEDMERKLQSIVSESGRPIEEVRQVFGEDLRESMTEAKTVEFLLANAKLEE